jgi:thiol-disulfide isomerase/thioredoxin
MRFLLKIFLFLITVSILVTVPASATLTDPAWSRSLPDGSKTIALHFFWSKTCPHCRKAKPFINELAQSYDWLELNSYEISENRKNAEYFMDLSKSLGNERFAVPAFMFCDQIVVGYVNDQTTGERLRNQLINCRKTLDPVQTDVPTTPPENGETKISIPLLGELDPENFPCQSLQLSLRGWMHSIHARFLFYCCC